MLESAGRSDACLHNERLQRQHRRTRMLATYLGGRAKS